MGSIGSPAEVLKLEGGIGTFGAGYGIKNNFFILTASTSGDYTMTTANNAFRTTINTPTANRNFILSNPASAGVSGWWFGICNKATGFTISVQYPSGTTIATIAVAPSATNGGTYAQFTSDGTTWFRSG